jgi:glutamyl-tRNA reductase
VTPHPLKLLAVDLKRAVPEVARAFALKTEELDELVRRARSEHGPIELVVVSDSERFELYSTDASHASVFRFVLRELLSRAKGSKELGELPTIEATGAKVAEHLLRRAACFDSSSGLEVLGKLNLAVARSKDAGALGAELSALFASAVEAGWRVYCETCVSDPTKSRPERDVAALEADRIVHEALVAWKTSRERASARRRPALLDTSYYRRYQGPSDPTSKPRSAA